MAVQREDIQKVKQCLVNMTISAPGSAAPLVKQHVANVVEVQRGVAVIQHENSHIKRKVRFCDIELLPEDVERLKRERFESDRRRKHNRNSENGLRLVPDLPVRSEPEPEPEQKMAAEPPKAKQPDLVQTWVEMGLSDVLEPLDARIRALAERRIDLMRQQDAIAQELRSIEAEAGNAQRQRDTVANALASLQA